MAYSVGGLVSGIDTTAIVESLVAAYAKQKTIMQEQQAALESRQTAYATLKSRLNTLKTAFEDISTVADFRSVTARSSSEDDVGVSVTGEGVIGRFSVQVNSLASSSMDVSSGFSARDTAGIFAQGTMNVTVGSTTTAVTIDASDSLDDVVDKINSGVDGVTAYVMETGDSSAPYRLVLAGEETGADNAVSIDTSGLDPATGTVPSFTQVTAAANAEVVVNGVTISQADNDIEDAVEGVTFHAYETTSSAVTVTVAADESAMVEKVQAMVDAWNSVVSQIRTQRVWNPDEDIKGAFVGESQPRAVLSALQTAFATTYGSGDLCALSQIGLSTTQDGDIELDTEVLTEALSGDFDGVVGFVTGESGVALTLSGIIDGMVDDDDGTVTARVDSLDEQIETMSERISDFQDRLDAYQARLEKQFLAMELAMARFQSAQGQLSALLSDSNSSED